MKHFTVILTVAFGLLGAPSAAMAADNIACIDTGYTQDEIAAVERFSNEFEVARMEDGPPEEVVTAVTRRAGECADTHGWSGEAIEDAVFYRFASILRAGLERRSPLSATQMRRVSEAIATADQERLGRIMGQIEDSALNGGTDPQHSQGDTLYMGRLFVRSGVPMTQPNAEYVGALIGARLMGERARQRFAAR